LSLSFISCAKKKEAIKYKMSLSNTPISRNTACLTPFFMLVSNSTKNMGPIKKLRMIPNRIP